MHKFSDPREASARITHIVTANESPLRKGTVKVSNKEASQILVEKFKVNERTARGWLTGAFNTHPITVENFRKFVREYASKSGLESDGKVNELAALLYGPGYELRLGDLDIRAFFSGMQPERNLIEKVCKYYDITQDEYCAIGQKDDRQHNRPVDFVLDIAFEHFTKMEKIAFAKLGALPMLATYNRSCFGCLWEYAEDQTESILYMFETLGILQPTGNLTWRIHLDVLLVARRYLYKLSPQDMKRSSLWLKRYIKIPRVEEDIFNLFRNMDIPLYKIVDFQELKQKREPTKKYKYREHSIIKYLTKKLLDIDYDSDWDAMLPYSHLIDLDDYILAQHLLKRGREENRKLVSILSLITIEVTLGSAILMNISICSSSIIALIAMLPVLASFFREYYVDDLAWIGIWNKLIPRIEKEMADKG